MSTLLEAPRVAMGAWRTILHQVKWDLRRMQWWSLVAMLVVAVPAWQATIDYWGESALLFTVTQGLLLLAIGVLLVQGDPPLSSTAFYRGRPLTWWTLPIAKSITLFLIMGLPAIVIGVRPILVFGPTPFELWSQLASVVGAVVVLTVLGLTWGAMATSILYVTLLVGVTALLSAVVMSALRNIAWIQLPAMEWIATTLISLLALDLYRRRRSARKIAATFLAVSLGASALRGFGQPMPKPAQVSTPVDSIRVSIDSVGLEQSHVARIAMTIESRRDIDLLQFDDNVGYSGGMSGTLAYVEPNQPSNALVKELADSAQTVAFSHRVNPLNATLSLRGGRVNGTRFFDVFLDSANAAGVRRANVVAVMALLDSNLTVGAKIIVQGLVVGAATTYEGRLSAALPSRSQRHGAKWVVKLSDSQLSLRLGAGRRTSDDPRQWQLVRTSLGEASARDDYTALSMRPQALRMVGANRSAVALSGFERSRTTWSAVVVPGLMRNREAITLTNWPISTNPSDSLDVYRLAVRGQFGYRATALISDSRGMRQ